MKKTVVLLLFISLCLPLFLSSCNLFKNGYIEVWSCCQEFDGIGFDFDQYLAGLRKDNTVRIEENDPWADREFDKCYTVTYSDKSSLSFFVNHDVETAKREQENYADLHALHRHRDPFIVAIRIDNLVVTPGGNLLNNEDGKKLKDNKKLIDFARSIGIEDEEILLSKINESSRIQRKDTDKSAEDILEIMSEKGFSSLDNSYCPDEQVSYYLFVPSDNSTTYEMYMVRGDSAKVTLLTYIEMFIIDSYRDHAHVYYSIGDDFCMYFMGTSADTLDLWNEIRK